jgi:hypothetical protein
MTDQLSPKARFDAFAGLTGFDSACVQALRTSLRHLLPTVNDLVRRVNEMMQARDASLLLGDLGGERRERLQSVMASFILRTINCNFDDEYCNYAHEVSHGDDIPPDLFSVGLALANDYVAETLPALIEDRRQLANMLRAWNRLSAVLREVTRQ